jgi:PAS domain S-box-containing protein
MGMVMTAQPLPTFAPSNGSQQLSQTLAQSIYQGEVIMDSNSKVIFANATAEMLLGFAPRDLLGRYCEEFLEEDVCALTALSAGQAHRYTTKLRHSDGRLIPTTITVTSITLFGQHVRLVSLSAIPHLGPLQDTLMMEQRLAGIGTLTASIAHELNTPLSVITSTCENLREIIALPDLPLERIERYAEMIEKSGWRAAKLVEVLQTYARGGHLMQETNPNQLVDNVLLMLAEQFRTKWGVKIATELGRDLKHITCDPNQITQVVVNLLTNARDAVQPHGGEIQLKTWNMPELGAVALAISDTGTGIPEGELDTIFEPFYTTKSKGEGTGLGLFVAAEIVREHKGWIRAQNNPARGATFTVMLPC